MVSLRHPQIVQVIGAVLEGQEPILVMQFMQASKMRGSSWSLTRDAALELRWQAVCMRLCMRL